MDFFFFWPKYIEQQVGLTNYTLDKAHFVDKTTLSKPYNVNKHTPIIPIIYY